MSQSPKSKRARAGAADPAVCNNLIGGQFVPPAGRQWGEVISPATGEVLCKVALSDATDVDNALLHAQKAFPAWSGLTVKSRAAIMFKFHHLMTEHAEELACLVVKENGKNHSEALASVAKGNETVEWACSMPQLYAGRVLQVSRGVECRDLREPLGVVGCVVPFNFPVMVPMWTVPIALTAGNCVILKPSEKVPATMGRVAELLKEAGVPDGVFQMVNGAASVVIALCDNPGISAVTFVGSSKVAEIVAKRCHATNKRVLALGGAKNHLVALPDCSPEPSAQDVVASFAGCAGQRCMAASALLLVGDTGPLLGLIVEKARQLKPGTAAGQVGPVIDAAARHRIIRYIDEAEARGAQVLLDGRPWAASQARGTWVGPTVLKVTDSRDPAFCEEIFGPVLCVLQVNTWEEALAIENANPHGNAASIYTTVGAHAEHFASRFRAAMIGVNIGVPVPREPFSFGGMYGTKSKFGDMDITGEGAMEFFTHRRKVTTKWVLPVSSTHDAAKEKADGDAASFVGRM